MSKTAAAIDEPDAALSTEVVYNETKSEKKSWKICNNVTLPRSEVVFVAQVIVILILLTFCILKLSFTKLFCEETSVWFSISFGLVGLITKAEDMNKVIDTSTRVFMAIVGPSGSAKTDLIFIILMENTFYPNLGTVLCLYKEMQPAVSKKVFSRTEKIN